MFVLIFLFCIVVSNLSVAYFGPVATPINAFFLIGLDLTIRDKLHDGWCGNYLVAKMALLVFCGAVITYFLNRQSINICVASVTAFSVSIFVDTFIYAILWRKERWEKMLFSNAGSSATDSAIFPTMAFGVVMPDIIAMQFLAKFCGGAFWVWALNRRWFSDPSADQRH